MLDYADHGGMSAQDIAPLLGVSRQRVLQIEQEAIEKVLAALIDLGVTDVDGMFGGRE